MYGDVTVDEYQVRIGTWFAGETSVGHHILYEYWPIFDEEGEWIDDEEVDVGNYRDITIVAGPFDGELEADAWRQANT